MDAAAEASLLVPGSVASAVSGLVLCWILGLDSASSLNLWEMLPCGASFSRASQMEKGAATNLVLPVAGCCFERGSYYHEIEEVAAVVAVALQTPAGIETA